MSDTHLSRRSLLRASAVAVAGLAGCANPVANPGTGAQTPGEDRVGVELVADGFVSPVDFEMPPDVDRYYVVDQPGQIRVSDGDGVGDAPFLDLADRVVDVNGYSERGLLGLAFHPEFADNRRFYVRYSAPPRSSTPDGYSHTFVLSEFRASSDGRSADPGTEREILTIPEPQTNHNAGAIAFGPDGYLYVGTGDGGGANDQGTGHVDDWYGAVPGGNGQDVAENLLGSVLRIDVDGREGDRAYAIPDDNPLVGTEGLDEHYAWGFRNPWRMSFDDGDLYVADVGQDQYEEVAVVEKGGNYGWNVREGGHCFGSPRQCPSSTPDGDPLRGPVIEYTHGDDGVSGVAVIGGYRYDAGALPGLAGEYVFADWQSNGRLFAASPPSDGSTPWPVRTVSMPTGESRPGSFVLALGRDHDGELYVLSTANPGVTGSTGAVHRLVTPDQSG